MKSFFRALFTPPSPIPLEVLLEGINSAESAEPIARLSLPDFLSHQLDPLESAISNAASSASGADGMTLLILQKHLNELCALQLARLSGAGVAADTHDEPK